MSFTVTIIGPDGAGKSTICRRLAEELSYPARYVYMGINLEVSNLLLPTTRLWLEFKRWRGKRPDMGCSTKSDGASNDGGGRQWSRRFKSEARLINLMCEEVFRQLWCRCWRMRGRIVLCDRDFYCDYYAYDVAPQNDDRSRIQRLHGWLLSHVYHRPDVVILLDAPAERLYARKHEGTLEDLDRRRREYRELEPQFRQFHVIDSTQPLDAVVQQAREVICDFVVAEVPVIGEARI